jgi:hypothetical protein
MLNRNSALKTQYSIVKMAIADNEGGVGVVPLFLLKKGVQF